MSNEFDFNSGGNEAGAGDDPSAEMPELALGPEKSNAGRNTAMILMAFAVVGAATIYFMRLKSGPPAALAAPAPEANRAKSVIADFLNKGQSSLKDLDQLLKDTAQVVKKFKDHEKLVQVPREQLKSNPFQLKEPEPEDIEAAKIKAEEAAKRKAELERDQARKDAAIEVRKLKLSFIIGGSKGRTCMINGMGYKVGGVVNGFTIKQIDPDKVILTKQIPGDPNEFTETLTVSK
jgi:hypothetical protein